MVKIIFIALMILMFIIGFVSMVVMTVDDIVSEIRNVKPLMKRYKAFLRVTVICSLVGAFAAIISDYVMCGEKEFLLSLGIGQTWSHVINAAVEISAFFIAGLGFVWHLVCIFVSWVHGKNSKEFLGNVALGYISAFTLVTGTILSSYL